MYFLWLGALVVLAGPALAAAAGGSDGAHEANFVHSMGLAASGMVDGRCDSRGAIFPPGAGMFSFTAAGGSLEHVIIDQNYTIVDRSNEGGLKILGSMDHRREYHEFPSGRGTISWNGSEAARIFGEGWPYGTRPPFDATYHADFVQSSPPMQVYAGTFLIPTKSQSNIDGALKPIQGDREYILVDQKGVNGTNVVVHMGSGTVDIRGDVSVYLEGGQIEGPNGFGFEPRPFKGYVSKHETDDAGVYQERQQHVILRLTGAHIRLDANQADLVCRNTVGRLVGSLVAFNARGAVQAGNHTVTFDRQELQLQGAMDFEQYVEQNDAPLKRSAQFDARGRFTAVGIDFADAGLVVRKGPDLGTVGLWTLVIAAIVGALAYAIKASGLFYTRLGKPALLDQPSRNLVVETLRATPWMNVPAIKQSTGLGRSTVRYQLAVLTRHGIVTATKTADGSRFAVRDAGIPLPPPPVDGLEGLARREIGSVPMRLSLLMRLVQREKAVSRSGAWNLVRKGIDDGVLVMEQRESGVWVRCA